jgi:hypothetical protein
MQTEFIFYNTIWKNFALFLLNALMIFALIALDFSFDIKTLSGLVLFGFGFLIFGYRLFDRRPRILINQQGIHDKRSNLGLIQWSEISNVHLGTNTGIQQITISLKQPSIWLAKCSFLSKWFWDKFGVHKFVVRANLQNMYPDLYTASFFISQMVQQHAP